MDIFFTFIKDNKEVLLFIVTVSGSIGFFLNYFLTRKKMKEGKKALRQQMITNNIAPMRQAWINDVRKASSEFAFSTIKAKGLIELYLCKLAEFNPDTSDHLPSDVIELEKLIDKEIHKLNEIYTYIDLLLPSDSNRKNEYRAEMVRKCMRLTCEYFNKIISEKKNIQGYIIRNLKIHPYLKLHTKKLLKKEWDETKSLKEIE